MKTQKTFHCLSWKQQSHIQVECCRKKTETCSDRSNPVSAEAAQGEKLRAHRRGTLSSEDQTYNGIHFPWAALMCTETPTAAADTFLRYLYRAEHSETPEHNPLSNSSTTAMVLQAGAPRTTPSSWALPKQLVPAALSGGVKYPENVPAGAASENRQRLFPVESHWELPVHRRFRNCQFLRTNYVTHL